MNILKYYIPLHLGLFLKNRIANINIAKPNKHTKSNTYKVVFYLVSDADRIYKLTGHRPRNSTGLPPIR